MVVHRHDGKLSHKRFFNIIDKISSSDLIILNITKFIPVRFFGIKKAEKELKL